MCFGDGEDFCISDNSNENWKSYSNLGYTYTGPNEFKTKTEHSYGYMAGAKYFKVLEIEVFTVTF